MKCSRRMFLASAACAALVASGAKAADTKTTTVYVKDMHCQTCAKKIAGRLYTVPGVLKVSTNVKQGVAIIVAQPSKTPSPKALWEAVEEATFQPTKIASPLGEFTKKPKI